MTFVGHPLLELTAPPEARETFLRRHGLDPARPVVALLPGSRRNALRAILPDLVRTAGVIAGRVPAAQFVLARAPHLDDELLAPLSDWPAGASRPVVVEEQTDGVLASADVAVLASGTVTVQAALHGCPMVVVYRVGPLTYRFGKPLLHVDTLHVNLIAGSRVVPSDQDDFTRGGRRQALKVLRDPVCREGEGRLAVRGAGNSGPAGARRRRCRARGERRQRRS